MRKSLLIAPTLVAIGFVAEAEGKSIGPVSVSLTKEQVATMCGEGVQHCEKACGYPVK